VATRWSTFLEDMFTRFDCISNDPERTLTLFSRSRHYLTLNISQKATDTAIVTIEGKWETAPKLLNGTSFNDL